MPKARHFAPPLVVFFLGCTALSSVAQAGWFDFGGSKSDAKPASDTKQADKSAAPAQDLDGSIEKDGMYSSPKCTAEQPRGP